MYVGEVVSSKLVPDSVRAQGVWVRLRRVDGCSLSWVVLWLLVHVLYHTWSVFDPFLFVRFGRVFAAYHRMRVVKLPFGSWSEPNVGVDRCAAWLRRVGFVNVRVS